jgi:hypothetical protein
MLTGVFLLSGSGLLFEIGLTRIFSATIWYHFAFVAISVALLGWGLGGFALEVLAARIRPSLERAALGSLLYAASIPLALAFIGSFPFRPELIAFYFGVALVPFFLAGMTLAMIFQIRRESAGKLYFADLAGASLGALGVTLLLSWLGGERAVVAVALGPLAAAACFSRRHRFAAGMGALLIAAAVASPRLADRFRVRAAPTKGMYQHLAAEPEARVALTGWNSYSRIDAVEGCARPCLARLYIDADAWTGVLRWDGKLASLGSLEGWFRALPFRLVERPETLVIGPGGGSDVLVALATGSERVTAVELNPLMLRFVRHYGARAGHLYDHARVEPVLSEGRSYVSRTERRFDVILLGFVDSWAAVASGGLSLSENYLYTVEAFRAYYDRLSDDGLLVILRWEVDIPRLVTNAVALLGARAARPRVAALLEKEGTAEDPPQMIFMLRKRPFTETETEDMMKRWSLARPVIVPGRHADEPFATLLSGRKTLSQFAAESERRVDPVYDDSPFFFATRKPWGLPGFMYATMGLVLAGIASLLTILVVAGRPRDGSRRAYTRSVLYFSSLGLGFMAVELALLQHLTLLVGHPLFTLSILLFTLLASGGLGSYASHRFNVARPPLIIATLAAAAALALPPLVARLLPFPFALRVAVAVLIAAPLGFAMGMPFPSGLRRVGQQGLPGPAFYWGLNGVWSVLGSLGTVAVAVTLGFREVLLAGSACYVVASLTARSLPGFGDEVTDCQPLARLHAPASSEEP